MLDEGIGEYVSGWLSSHADENYRAFNARLLPTVNPQDMLGVRVPDLRRLAKELVRRDDLGEFLGALPHQLFEENQLHALVVAGLRDYDRLLVELTHFLPYVDNWSTCDALAPRVLARRPEETLRYVRGCLSSGETYAIRFGVGVLRTLFLGDVFAEEQLDAVVALGAGDYYVDMARAWYVAEALVWQEESAWAALCEHRLDRWTHNKAIQKAIESRRVSDELKGRLRTLRSQ